MSPTKTVTQRIVHGIPPLHFCWRLPVYWSIYRSDRLRWSQRLPNDALCIDEEISLRGPDSGLGFGIFHSMAFERATRWELKRFLRLAQGCRALLDVGASAGFFSTLFVTSRTQSCQVLSVEPDAPSFAVLESSRQRNSRPEVEWQLANVGLGSRDGQMVFYASDFGVGAAAGSNSCRGRREIPIVLLSTLCSQRAFQPDLIKFDVESMEYEIILSSLDYLAETRPRIHLELHSQQISGRGLDPGRITQGLYETGYRMYGCGDHGYSALLREATRSGRVWIQFEHLNR